MGFRARREHAAGHIDSLHVAWIYLRPAPQVGIPVKGNLQPCCRPEVAHKSVPDIQVPQAGQVRDARRNSRDPGSGEVQVSKPGQIEHPLGNCPDFTVQYYSIRSPVPDSLVLFPIQLTRILRPRHDPILHHNLMGQ
jgi:hypothetical protein